MYYLCYLHLSAAPNYNYIIFSLMYYAFLFN